MGIARSSGADHTRWPSAFCDGYGLISFKPPASPHASPHASKTTNRRAGCGRPASPVRREEEAILPLPLSLSPAWHTIVRAVER
jgi:hypothetical protein